MNSIFQIAKNTYREILRDKILYGLLVVSIVMLGFAMSMAQLSFAEQAKITIDFTLVVLNISSVIISIFLGAQLLYREVENKTLLTLLTHPVSRSSFLVGKILGLVFVILTLFLFFCVILFAQSLYYEYGTLLQLMVSMFGILLESLIMLTMTIFLSSFLRVSIVITVSIAMYLVGHWMESLKTIAGKTGDSFLSSIYTSMKFTVPNLELMNWKSLITSHVELSHLYIGKVSLYSLLWLMIFTFASIFIFNKKDIT